MTEKKMIPLLFDSLTIGTKEYGYIPRQPHLCPDDEDLVYERYLKKKGLNASVLHGIADIIID